MRFVLLLCDRVVSCKQWRVEEWNGEGEQRKDQGKKQEKEQGEEVVRGECKREGQRKDDLI